MRATKVESFLELFDLVPKPGHEPGNLALVTLGPMPLMVIFAKLALHPGREGQDSFADAFTHELSPGST